MALVPETKQRRRFEVAIAPDGSGPIPHTETIVVFACSHTLAILRAIKQYRKTFDETKMDLENIRVTVIQNDRRE